MYGVIRFLDTELLPASSPPDYPKVIKSGIDEEGQHPKSPAVTGPSGVATVLHKIGRPELLERLFDAEGTHDYDLRIRSGQKYFNDMYVIRRGLEVEMGFINSEEEWGCPGIRYRISPEPPSSQYRVGKWVPISTSDLGSPWGGSDYWVRGQGEAFGKALWYHRFWNKPDVEVRWSGMTEEDKAALDEWLKERSATLAEESRISRQEYEERKARYGGREHLAEERFGMENYYKSRLACRADCGEQNPQLTCSKCKVARYCSRACQEDDWKYHKTYCGKEESVAEKYRKLLEMAP